MVTRSSNYVNPTIIWCGFFFYNKQLYFMKSICWYHIWSYKNTNLLNVCVVLFVLHIWCPISSLNLSTYKK